MGHKHSQCCKHENIEFCAKCKVPYCVDCGHEWAEKCQLEHAWTYQDYPHTVPYPAYTTPDYPYAAYLHSETI